MAQAQLTARNWIGGEWIDSATRRDSVNPAAGKTIGTYADGAEAEANQAIVIALESRKAFPCSHH